MAEKIILMLTGAITSAGVGKLGKLAIAEYIEYQKCKSLAEATDAMLEAEEAREKAQQQGK